MQTNEPIYLLLLNDGAAPAQGGEQMSFRERKAAELRTERGETPDIKPAPAEPSEPETPQPPLESVQDDIPELHDGDESEDEYLDSDEALDDETPFDEIDDEPEQTDTVDWEKRFKDTQAELTRVNEEREERNAEHADMMAGALQLQHELEDRLTKAKEHGDFYLNTLNNQIGQLEQAFNSGQIDPENMGKARQMYQQLANQKHQLEQRQESLEKARQETEQLRKTREAQITRVRLARTIPDWSERKYGEMRQEAVKRGYSVEEFNEVTDHRYFELLHDSMMLRNAEKVVTNVRGKRKAKPPRNRNQRRQPRDGRGRFEKAQREFRDNPNTRGAFANMKEQQLRNERRGR